MTLILKLKMRLDSSLIWNKKKRNKALTNYTKFNILKLVTMINKSKTPTLHDEY